MLTSVFLTYTFSVTRGLGVVDDVTYVRAFQGINDMVRTPWFMTVFFGTAPAAVVAGITALRGRRWPALLAAGCYTVGVIAVTVLGNLPLNDELGRFVELDPLTAAAARNDFEDRWNILNAIRAAASTMTFLLLAAARALHSTSSPFARDPLVGPSLTGPEPVRA